MRSIIPFLFVSTCLCAVIAACGSSEGGASGNNQPSDTAEAGSFDEDRWKPATPPPSPPLNVTWEGPLVKAAIEVAQTSPAQYAAVYQTTVPTGGYALRRDHVEHVRGELSIYLFLDTPAPEQAVTEAMETLSGRYDAGEKPINFLRIYVTALEGGKSSADGTYVFDLAAFAPDQQDDR